MAFNYPLLAKNGSSIFPPKTILGVNQYLQSPNGRFRLVNQPDLNLVLLDGANPIWVADRNSTFSNEFYPQVWKKDDASQVYMNYILGLLDLDRRRIWNTKNSDIPGGDFAQAAERTYLQLQDDGNMVIVDLFPVWKTNSSAPVKPQVPAVLIPPGTKINPGNTFTAGNSRLVFQRSGNLAFYGADGRLSWASNTQNKGGAFAVMEKDGNLVIYTADSKPLWSLGTGGNPGAYARIQEDGSFSIVRDRVCWARFGFTPSIKPVRVISFGGNPYKDGLPTYDRVIWTF
ncbi:putidacin L1 family lectin-like bacteriocin [Pseudomonas mosselii]|uniref:putidacin L1 family lectin-like bacteriocin n=1 Tax=Pseudomonas mosselii TaxID=78327 RepID=UPI002B052928|nr:putidacin L1 family lectin-like bacteriocin [Pseudomonas mosselii]MEA3233889.1 putidacin L1 family lectin-like bacteriocin [Pseudomonas mosselii]